MRPTETSRHRGAVIWLTGLSGSGKTTIASEVQTRLGSAVVLDGDVLRTGLCSDLGFSPADRSENIRRTAEVAALMADVGLVVIVALISPYRADRERAKGIIGAHRFLEVFVDTPIEACETRDPKGLYRRARAGDIPEFTGVSAPYEIPESPDLVIRTSDVGPAEAAALLLSLLEVRDMLQQTNESAAS